MPTLCSLRLKHLFLPELCSNFFCVVSSKPAQTVRSCLLFFLFELFLAGLREDVATSSQSLGFHAGQVSLGDTQLQHM